MKLSVLVFLVLEDLFNCDLFATSSHMAQVYRTKSSFTCNSINFVFISRRLYVWIARLTYFTLMTKISLIFKGSGLICFSFCIFVQDEWSIGMHLKWPLYQTLLMLQLWVHLKIFVSLGLLFRLNFIRGSVAGFWRFESDGMFIYLGLDSSIGLLWWPIEFDFWIILTGRKCVSNVHFIFFRFINLYVL